jgi:dihydroorotate dehydrogenase
MPIAITRPGKFTLELETPVMPAAGTFGFGDVYRDLVNIEKIGAVVTNPLTYDGWSPASGTRVVPMEGGVLVHTGLPNPGLNRALKRYRGQWALLPVPVIVHLVATGIDHVRKCASRLDEEDSVDAIELGLGDDITWEEVEELVDAAVSRCDKPVLVRLPFQESVDVAEAAADAGAAALVLSAPPRGTARDPRTGRLVSGRIYGPLVKPVILRLVGQLARRLDEVPVIAAGGVHTPDDARDYMEAGARAVQVDSVIWVQPNMLEVIGRDLGGWIVTREADGSPDDWHPGMGDTEREKRRRSQRPAAEEDHTS